MEEPQNLLNALKSRQNYIFRPITTPTCNDYSEEIRKRISTINEIIRRNNQKTKTLSDDQKEARTQLRLNDVLNFITRINLGNQKLDITDLEKKSEATKKLKLECEAHVNQLENERNSLVSQLLDEKRGADQVNKYLNHSLGIDSLQLVAVEDESQARYKFHIMRGDQPAYNMSEGERSLVSFCYFLAKLEDSDTPREQMIIYIDDPVSSLDTNHIFFVFSLIESVLTIPNKDSNNNKYGQLFISTHNLDFLKYLKRVTKPNEDGTTEFLMVEKEMVSSRLILMPKYLKKYQTEFIYLFHQLYKMKDANISDENNATFYNLGNNLRKFLEAYLFFKYPSTKSTQKLKPRLHKFFGDDVATITLINRIINEFSHLEEHMDRGMKPIDMPELQKSVRSVLNAIKEKDKDQYQSLLESIGESND